MIPFLSPRMEATPHEQTMPVAIGDVIHDRYVVESFVGAGSVSAVFGVRNVMTEERLALKCLKLEACGAARVVERFAREARAAMSIESAFVVAVHDVGTLPSGSPFLVMEYLSGVDLETWGRGRDAIAIRQAAELALQMCEALATAHARGVVHRDIQPKNLFVAERAGVLEIKVLDIGISKSALTDSVFGANLPIVKTLNLAAGPLYLAPEQLRSAAEVDGRTDIWSIGMVLYEVLASKVPFAGATIMESCAAILQSEPEPIINLRPDVSGGLARIIERCLQKDPAQRFQNVAELAAALTRYAPSRARASAERAANALRQPVDLAIDLPAQALETVFSSRPPPLATSSAPPARSAPPPTSAPPSSAPPTAPSRSVPPPPSSTPSTSPSLVAAPASSTKAPAVSAPSSAPIPIVATRSPPSPLPLPPPATLPSAPPPEARLRLPLLAIGAVVLIGLGLLLGFVVGGARHNEAAAGPPTTSSTHVSAATPLESAAVPAPVETAAAAPPDPAPTETAPVATTTFRYIPPRTAATPPLVTASAPTARTAPMSVPAPDPPAPTGRTFRREM